MKDTGIGKGQQFEKKRQLNFERDMRNLVAVSVFSQLRVHWYIGLARLDNIYCELLYFIVDITFGAYDHSTTFMNDDTTTTTSFVEEKFHIVLRAIAVFEYQIVTLNLITGCLDRLNTKSIVAAFDGNF